MGSVDVDKTASPLFSDGSDGDNNDNDDDDGDGDEEGQEFGNEEGGFLDAERRRQRENLRAAREAAFGTSAARAREKKSVLRREE
jgi:hypothetical protein